MVRALVGLFAQSPFKPLHAHMDRVMSCVQLVPRLMEAVVDGDAEAIAAQRKAITRAEHEADIVKNELRDHLPRTLFLPVSRADLLRLLHHQDDIADGAEDAAIVACLKPVATPVELREQVLRYADLCVDAARVTDTLMGRLDELLETGFSGPGTDEVHELINRIGQKEWEADKAAFKLLQAMFQREQALPPVDLVLWMKLCEALGDIANASEQVANHLRLMLAR